MNGQITVDLNGKKYNLKEGDVVRIPPKLKHRFINMNDQVATVLFILTPSLI
jgi:quercetin dioxygenase-like cupin family protein